MIHIPFFLPLFVGGLASAVWRDYRQPKPLLQRLGLPAAVDNAAIGLVAPHAEKVFDDMGELHHYQRVSWYAFALSASGLWFYPPAMLASIPLLSYNTYNFAKAIHNSDLSARKSPMTVFEVIGVAGTLATGRPLMASLMFLFVFGSRNLQLQTRSLANIDLGHVMDSNFAKVWVSRGGAEIELPLGELQTGDVVVVHAGDLVLVEGAVVAGEGVVTQYSLQKKMKSVSKQAGDMLFRFTQLESGCLHVQIG